MFTEEQISNYIKETLKDRCYEQDANILFDSSIRRKCSRNTLEFDFDVFTIKNETKQSYVTSDNKKINKKTLTYRYDCNNCKVYNFDDFVKYVFVSYNRNELVSQVEHVIRDYDMFKKIQKEVGI